MIAFVKGILEDVEEDKAVIDVNGIGYNVYISLKTVSSLPQCGDMVKLYTYTVVREDSISLYGFLYKEELNLFKKLITVNGIGPKGGLALLSTVSVQDLIYAILSGDSKLISSAPGIGKKTAERVILDLKDKLSWNSDLITLDIQKENLNVANDINSEAMKEAIGALVALGYAATDAKKAVGSVDINNEMSVEDILKESLKYLL